MTVPMSRDMKYRMDQCIAQLDEDKKFCTTLRNVDKVTCQKQIYVVQEEASDREALLREAITVEQRRAADLAQQVGQEQGAHIWWAVGGFIAGIMVGVTTAAVLVLNSDR